MPQSIKLKSRNEVAAGTMAFHLDLVSAMQKLLRDAGVKDTNVRAEEFSGY